MSPSQLLQNGPCQTSHDFDRLPPPLEAFNFFDSPVHPPPPSRGVRSFDRPPSARSMPVAGRSQKKLQQIAGLDMTGEEFDALPAAVRRKVRYDQQDTTSFSFFFFRTSAMTYHSLLSGTLYAQQEREREREGETSGSTRCFST